MIQMGFHYFLLILKIEQFVSVFAIIEISNSCLEFKERRGVWGCLTCDGPLNGAIDEDNLKDFFLSFFFFKKSCSRKFDSLLQIFSYIELVSCV